MRGYSELSLCSFSPRTALQKKGENRVVRPLLLHLHRHLSGPFLLRHSNLRLALLLPPLGGRGSLLGYLGPSALLPPLWGWRAPSSCLTPGLPLGSAGIRPCSARSSAVGTLYRPMRTWTAPPHQAFAGAVCFDSFICYPATWSIKGYSSGLPLPLMRQRRAFLNNLSCPGPARAVKVGHPCSPSLILPKQQKREKTPSRHLKQRKNKRKT